MEKRRTFELVEAKEFANEDVGLSAVVRGMRQGPFQEIRQLSLVAIEWKLLDEQKMRQMTSGEDERQRGKRVLGCPIKHERFVKNRGPEPNTACSDAYGQVDKRNVHKRGEYEGG